MTHIPFDTKILVIIGPSAAGKSTIVQNLHRQGVLEVTPTWTTRPARPGELSKAVEHAFVTDAEFDNLLKEGFFLETVQLFGLDFRYGLPRIIQTQPGAIPTIMLRAPLIPRLLPHYPNFVVYQIEDNLDRIRDRLQARQQAGEQLGSRLEDYEKEVSLGKQQAHRTFINNDVTQTAHTIHRAVQEDFVL